MRRRCDEVAVLCAAAGSVYHRLPGVTVFDADRDARTFGGGVPVVCHPPCRAWSAFTRHQAKPAEGEAMLGPWCVDQLRTCGGVLEQPAYSRLFDFCGLPKPGEPAVNGLWSMAVDQSWFEFPVCKRTWLVLRA